jgi:hypothetical protein
MCVGPSACMDNLEKKTSLAFDDDRATASRVCSPYSNYHTDYAIPVLTINKHVWNLRM